MQEALYSLKQMARLQQRFPAAQAHLPYISSMTDPTTGGVSASLAMLGDLNLAGRVRLSGFAAHVSFSKPCVRPCRKVPSVVEFLLEHGALDMIVDRRDMRDRIARRTAHAAEAAPAALPEVAHACRNGWLSRSQCIPKPSTWACARLPWREPGSG